MDSFFKAKNKEEAISNISARLDVPSNWKEIITQQILKYKKSSLKKFPSSVQTHRNKPSFALNDGDLLYMFAISFSENIPTITQVKYGGSSDSVFMHEKAQLSEGGLAPDNMVGIFITECASSQTRIWTVDVWVGTQTSLFAPASVKELGQI